MSAHHVPRAALVALALVSLPALADGHPVDDKKGATKDDYAIDTSKTTAQVKVKADGSLSIAIQPKNGLKVHPQAPLEVKLKPSEGVKTAKTKLGRSDVVDDKAASPELKTTFVGDKAGDGTVEAQLSFFLCSDAWCQRMTDKVTIAVAVVE